MWNAPVDWLLQGEPWTEYRTRIDLLGQAEDDSAVRAARERMLAHPAITALLAGLADWPGMVLASHKSASQPFHRLTFLADLGLRADDPAMAGILAQVLQHPSPEGPFRLVFETSRVQGGRPIWGWALCDAPLLVYALVQCGLERTPQVEAALAHLLGLVRANGWPCAVSPELGGFRGPGRKGDPCPYANLAMLKALSVSAAWNDSDASRVGAETLLSLWTDSRTLHPYMFYMGTDFRRLKAPLVWYDLLHVLDVLSRFRWLAHDARLLDMLTLLKGKADAHGRFTPESVWTAWKDWDFGQKRAPSRWLTLLCWRIIQRVEAPEPAG
jgi:hypothetical protein